MSAGTLAVTNGSTTVNGTGTTFTTELSAGDFVYVTVGGAPYTLVVASIASDTSLALAVAFDGPTTSGLSWSAVPASVRVAITQKILNDFAMVARGQILEKANWQKVYSSDQSVTVTLPDLSTFTGPGWGYLSSQMLKKDGSVALTGNLKAPAIEISSAIPFIDFHFAESTDDYTLRLVEESAGKLSVRNSSGYGSLFAGAMRVNGGTMGVVDSSGSNIFDWSVSSGDLTLARTGTGGINFNGPPLKNLGPLSFVSVNSARQSLINMGVSSASGSRILIPISTSQAFMIQSVTQVITTNASGDATITFPLAFTTIVNVTVANGDAAVGLWQPNVLNTIRTTGFDVRVGSTGSVLSSGAYRVNYIATGVVNI